MSPVADNLKVHLVGSVPLDDADTVFRTVCGAVGPYLKRLPDGETGTRRLWIGFIREMLMKHPFLEMDPEEPPLQLRLWNGQLHREIKQVRFKAGVDPARAKFETGYAQMAIDSFAGFDKLQSAGVIPKSVRFLIAIPTPLAPAYNYISKNSRDAFIDVFSDHLIDEVAKIAAALPNDRIAIQWDVLQEILVWENYFKTRPADYKEKIISALARVCNAVPEPIELGLHYCYGSPHDEHLLQPTDTATMVEMTHLLARAVKRPIEFIHMPVPKPRTDLDYYRPLAKLDLSGDTELYLGLIHQDDDAGNRTRLAAARQFVKVAGVASECGWGRGNSDRVPKLLETHRAICC